MRRTMLTGTLVIGLAALGSDAGAQQGGAPAWPDPPQPPAAGAARPGAAAPATPRRPAPPKPAAAPAAEPADAAAAAPGQAAAPKRRVAKPKPAGAVQSVKCEGPFAKDATHETLAKTFGEENVVFTAVEGEGGAKLNASVVFPNDPKRRLEVLWHDETARARPQSIVITGESTWVGPRNLKLGVPLAEVEKQNGKAFRVTGLDADGMASVRDWQAGAFTKLTGGCEVGLRLAPDPKSKEASRAKLVEPKDLPSNNAGVREIKPKVAEIVIGYSQ
jgi:hypothetical protein